jgi:cytochrome P450
MASVCHWDSLFVFFFPLSSLILLMSSSSLNSIGGRPRIARDEVEFSGCPIKKGEFLLLDSRAANRDPSVFPHAQEVNFDRDPNPQITFGRGIHACLGQQIARMELRVLWTTLLTRLPSIRLAVPPTEVPWRPAESATTGPAHLPVTWG